MFYIFILIVTAVSCDKDFAYPEEPNDPKDISGIYDVIYRMWVDDKPVMFGAFPGRMEVTDLNYEEETLRFDFYPDNPVFTIPPIDHDTPNESLFLGEALPTVDVGKYTFGEIDRRGAGLSFIYREEPNRVYMIGGHLTMGKGSITAKTHDEIANSSGTEAAQMRPYFGKATPGVYHKLEMAIDIQVLNPNFPQGVYFDPETGLPTEIPFDPEVGPAFYVYHFEITSK